MDKLAALRAFAAVAEAGGFSKAARRLGVATSSVARTVDALEAELGTALLTRSTRAVTLTDSGATYLAQIARVLAELEEADASVADAGVDAVGPLRVSAPVTFARLCLAPHLAQFMAANPRVRLELVLTDTPLDLGAERIDVAVRIGVPAADPGLIVRRLREHHRYVVAAREYLERAGVPSEPAELAEHECLRFAYDAGAQHWSFRRAEVVLDVAIGGRFAANNADVLREAVLAGAGIALLPQWLVEADVQSSGRLRRLFERWAVNPHRNDVCLYAAYLPNRRHSRKVEAFISFALQSLAAVRPE